MVDQTERNQEALAAIGKGLEQLHLSKPAERNETARRYAIVITEMEKAFAYFKTFVVDEPQTTK